MTTLGAPGADAQTTVNIDRRALLLWPRLESRALSRCHNDVATHRAARKRPNRPAFRSDPTPAYRPACRAR